MIPTFSAALASVDPTVWSANWAWGLPLIVLTVVIHVIGVVVDVLGIPWSYVLASYVRERGDRWREQARAAVARP